MNPDRITPAFIKAMGWASVIGGVALLAVALLWKMGKGI